MAAHGAFLLQRVQRYKAVLHRPDAWVCPLTRRLVFEKPSDSDVYMHGYIPLAIGDCVHYTQVMRMPFVTHDMVYVGLGCVVGFQRRGTGCDDKHTTGVAANSRNGCIQIDRLDVIKVAGNRLFKSKSGGRSMLSREAVATRALLSLGWFKYKGVSFNCQHAFELILGNRSFSLGAVRMIAAIVPAVTVLYLVALVGLFILLFCRQGDG